jgi:hypothetical protein
MRRMGLRAHLARAPIGVMIAIAAMLKFAAVAGAFGVIWIHVCGSWTPGGGSTGGTLGVARSGASNQGVSTPYQCPTTPDGSANGMEVFGSGSGVPSGSRAYWEIDAPQNLIILQAHTEGSGMITDGVNSNWGWGGGFFWQGGGAQVYQGEIGYSSPPLFSTFFGWQIICGWSTCDGNNKPGEISVLGLEIEAGEASGPSVSTTPGSLGDAVGWVRGWWPVAFTADGPSGACQLAATLAGLSVSEPVNEPLSNITWHQCPAGSFSQSFNTASVASGPSVPLVMSAHDAAYDYTARAHLSSSVTKYVDVDNDPVSVSMSGPTDALSTAGVQYVTAIGSAGPSGVAGLSCSLNGGSAQWYPGSSARVAVQNLGSNSVTCSAANNARDASGNVAWSAAATWTLSIRQPTTAAISFGSRIVNALRCHTVKERVRVAARWVTVRRHNKTITIKRRAHTKVVKIVHCHPRVVRVRVRVKVKGHWRWRIEQHVRLPQTVQLSTRRARYGATTKVAGWLGESDGIALGGQTVRILTAPNNGSATFTQATVATTGPNGVWSATLPAGPSRLVEAVYDGAGTVEPANSGQVQLIVPAVVKLKITPRHTHWWRSPHRTGTIQISGRVLGGYIPGAHQQLLQLRIGVVGIPGIQGTIGIPNIRPDGRYHTTWTPAPGNGTVHYWFSVSTLHEADFPYAPGNSRHVDVTVR